MFLLKKRWQSVSLKIFFKVPKNLKLSSTYDYGSTNFAHPYNPLDRPKLENTNGLIKVYSSQSDWTLIKYKIKD